MTVPSKDSLSPLQKKPFIVILSKTISYFLFQFSSNLHVAQFDLFSRHKYFVLSSACVAGTFSLCINNL